MFTWWPRSLSTPTLVVRLNSERREHDNVATGLVSKHVCSSGLAPPSALQHEKSKDPQGDPSSFSHIMTCGWTSEYVCTHSNIQKWELSIKIQIADLNQRLEDAPTRSPHQYLDNHIEWSDALHRTSVLTSPNCVPEMRQFWMWNTALPDYQNSYLACPPCLHCPPSPEVGAIPFCCL